VRVHDDAFLALIRSDAGLASTTFEGTVTNRPARYVSVFSRETRDVNRYTGPHSWLENEYTVHSVGSSPEQAKWAREHMLAKTLDATPTVAGWSCGRVRFVTSQPLAVDRDVTPPIWYCVDVLAFSSQAS
jgi:hypothetical protein